MRGRARAREARTPGRCALPQAKTLDGYDWGSVAWPDSFGRDDLLSLSFLDRHEDVVPVGDVGTGNYAEKRIMSGNGLPPQVIRSRQPRPFA